MAPIFGRHIEPGFIDKPINDGNGLRQIVGINHHRKQNSHIGLFSDVQDRKQLGFED